MKSYGTENEDVPMRDLAALFLFGFDSSIVGMAIDERADITADPADEYSCDRSPETCVVFWTDK